ncbi:hypothetical protein [Tenacibaculum finnmarkense]|uniref:hypothetical protein n=1 Tax=Tenacibaculum finnmarkense TaxID=2781243 RepID=UPI001E32DCF3|nr:hypothetical protein [Tenacibaculum finnmarkense]MCD8402676.1 hypothetical protein [Tenacibaculum finnmarkense genomovar finnmarkense]
MSLFTLLTTIATQIASDDKAREEIYKFTKQTTGFITDLFKNENDLPKITEEDFNNIVKYTEMLASLLGQGAKVDKEVNLSKMKVISDIFNELCFSEKGYMQKPLLNYINSSVEEFEKTIASTFQTPSTLKKISRYVEKFEIEDEFYGYLCRVMFSDKIMTNEEQEYLDVISSSFGINKFDRRLIESEYKN